MSHIVYNVLIHVPSDKAMTDKQVETATANALAVGKALEAQGATVNQSQAVNSAPSVARASSPIAPSAQGGKGQWERKLNARNVILREGEHLARIASILGIAPQTREDKAKMMLENIECGDLIKDEFNRWVYKGRILSGNGSGSSVFNDYTPSSEAGQSDTSGLGEIDLDETV